jgi:hypothetical protein
VAEAIFDVLPISDGPTLAVTPNTADAGRTIAIRGQGYPDACVTFALRLAGEVVPLRLRAIDTAPANSTVVVTAEFDLPESAPAGTTTVELECWAQDAELLATAVGAVTVAAATLPWFLGVISLVVLLVVIALALVHARRTRRPPVTGGRECPGRAAKRRRGDLR